ncbi:MAG: fatty acid desaturase [Anaerolineaceae bacterium]|nr:fatty acid desaturase [Anaerolineaceae bacterium]MDE0330151.1 fatty acid desaturase [Anaerolineaceae bacterium]
MGYPALADVRKTFRVDWYRSPVPGAKLRELSRRSDRQAWFQAGGHLTLFILTGALVFHFWTLQLQGAFLAALFCHGTVTSFMRGVAAHELGHGTVFRTKWLNKAFLYPFSLIGWWDHYDYGSSHTYHHRYTLHPEGDREVLLPLEPSLASLFMLQLFTINITTKPRRVFDKGGLISTVWVTLQRAFGVDGPARVPIFEWFRALHADQPEEFRKSVRWSRLLLLFHGSILLIAIATGLWVLPLIFSTATFTANGIRYFVTLPQHCGLQDNVNDFRKSVRSMRLNPLFSFLYWRMEWHLEHHMYAGVPCYNLRKLYEEIADDLPEPRTLIGAWKEMRMVWRVQKGDPDYQFDTPLPPTARRIRSEKPEEIELESSIGDLAPAGLQ